MIGRSAGFLVRIGASTALIMLAAESARAQEGRGEIETACVSFDLAPGHWAAAAVRRLDATGVAEYHGPRRSVPACKAVERFEAAQEALEAGDPMAGLVRSWLERLLAEYPGLADVENGGVGLSGGAVGMGMDAREGLTAPGMAEFPPDRTGAIEVEDRTTAVGSGHVAIGLYPHLSSAALLRADADGLRFEQLDLVGGAGAFVLQAGRGSVGYGLARGGAVTISSSAPLDRIEAGTARPVRLPGPARHLGTIAFTTFVGRVSEARHAGDPFFWGGSGSLRPHPRLTLSVHRAALFGGDENAQPVTLRNVLNMMTGRLVGIGFENQVVSVEGSFRLPTEGVLPVTVYTEWGAEDAAGAWWSVPGRIFGVYLPLLPGLESISGGGEYAEFAASCCGNPEWYRHWSFPGSWALGDRPLGHPLGGDGKEWMGYLTYDRPDQGLHVDTRARRRTRRAENLFSPGSDGLSWIAEVDARLRLGAAGELFARLEYETSDEWDQREMSVGGRLFLARR